MKRTSQLAHYLLFGLLALTACRQSPKEQMPEVDFKRTDNTAIIRLEGEPDRLTPLLTINNYANQVQGNNIFMTLLTIDPTTLELVPSLVQSRPEVRDLTEGEFAGGVSYTFSIHNEAVWSDGRPVTGNDYVFTLKALLNPRVPAAPYRPYVSLIKDVVVDAANPKRFTVFCNEKFIQGEEYVGNTFYVMPEHLYDPNGDLKAISIRQLTDPAAAEQLANTNPKLQQFADQFADQKYARDPQFVNGCGPYRLQQWETGQQIVLVRNDNWWGDKLVGRYPALEADPAQLVFKPISDATTSVAALKAEELDVAYNLDPTGFEELKATPETAERYNFFTPPSLSYLLLYVNTRDPRLNDKRVRQAIAHAIDVQEIIDNVYNGFGQRLASPVHPSAEYYNKNLQPYAFNVERARELLSAAGWKDSNNNGTVDKAINGQPTELVLDLLIPANRETSRATALLIQDNARRAGIGITPVAQESSVLFDNLKKGNYALASAGRSLTPTLWNPVQNFHTTKGDNRTGFGNAQTDAMIESILVTLDKEKRDQLYRDFQAILYDELPEIPIFVPTNRLIIHKRFDTTISTLYPGFLPALLKLREPFRENLLN